MCCPDWSDLTGSSALLLIALVLTALVFIAPVLWILEAVPVPLAGPLDVLPANLLLLAVAAVRVHHHQGPHTTTRRGLVTASRRVTRIRSISDRKETGKRVPLTLNRWAHQGD